MAANLDLKKELKPLYSPAVGKVSEVTIPEMNYLMIDGAGDPNSESWDDAIKTIYPLAYGVRAICKADGKPFTVMPLEGLWWWENMPDDVLSDLTQADKDAFLWTAMIVMPEFVTEALLEQAREVVRKKKNPPLIDNVRFEAYAEGQAVQIMHMGPYADEGPTIQTLHAYIEAEGYSPNGKHHEIYLNDPRKVAPEKVKTIIRQPYK